MSGILSKQWGLAQQLYQEVTGNYPKHIPCTWAEMILPALWDFAHNIWTYRNEIKHGVTLAEQSHKRREQVVALVVDRYRYRPHLDRKYQFLFRKPLTARLEEGNRALYAWLSSLANLSSLSTKPPTTQRPMNVYTTYQRLSNDAIGCLRRPLRRLRRLRDAPIVPLKKCSRSNFALGISKPTKALLLPALWNFTPRTKPIPLQRARRKRKNFNGSIVSSQASKLWDRGRRARILA